MTKIVRACIAMLPLAALACGQQKASPAPGSNATPGSRVEESTDSRDGPGGPVSPQYEGAGGPVSPQHEGAGGPVSPKREGAGGPVSPKREARRRIVFLGDSLTAGYGLARDQSVPALIQARLDRQGYDYEVVNAGV